MAATVKIKGYSDTTTSILIPQVVSLKKFVVNFRRGKTFTDEHGNISDYQGQYGFDWLRDEYIYSSGGPNPLCTNIGSLKKRYKTIKYSITPYGKDYYPAWLSIFPHTKTEKFAHGSTMHRSGVSLDLEIEELETLSNDATKLLFESGDKNLIITPQEINLSSLIIKKETKNLGSGLIRNFYHSEDVINIKSQEEPLTKHTEIKVFAQLGNQKKEVGKLMVYQNNKIPKAEFVAINVIAGTTTAALREDFQFNIARQSFNQALIRAQVKVDTNFNINELPTDDSDVDNFKKKYLGKPRNDLSFGLSNSALESYLKAFTSDLIYLYEKFGKHAPTTGSTGLIEGNTNKKTYLFFTQLDAGGVRGMATSDGYDWGNAYIVYKAGLLNRRTICHEAAHSFSLPHTFESVGPPPHRFKQGYTDNIMDYTWGPTINNNPFNVNDKMFSFFKWQWDILRQDRSLIHTY